MSERARQRLRALTSVHARGLSLPLAAAAVGVHRTTAERWRKRRLCDAPLVRARGPRRGLPCAAARTAAVGIVRDTHGLAGAAAIAHSVTGLSRRAAAAIKEEALRRMEIERRARAQHVTVASPGVVRGFDGMDLGRGRGHLLVAADGCVPYRTSWIITTRYDEQAVARALAHDFERAGAPLVLRFDRALAHHGPAVRDLLRAHSVLPLHGAPHYPQYYGQLERQNREHRAWIANGGAGDLDLDAMMETLNARWRRSTLGWSTAAECWAARPVLEINRTSLREEVEERVRRFEWHLCGQPHTNGLAARLAVKQALTSRGLLRIETRRLVLGGYESLN